MLYILLAIFFGAIFAGQTAINAQLKKYVLSPFLTSLISFTIGVVFLTITLVISGTPIGIPFPIIVEQPIYLWLGGILGAFALTINILLFPYLGSVQTTIFPILGMTVMSLVIDHYGWFHSTSYSFGFQRGIGIILLLVGLSFAVSSPKLSIRLVEETKQNSLKLWFLRLIGIIAGMMLAIQVAVNGHLGAILHSPIKAALLSFFVGMLLLIVTIAIKDHSYRNVTGPIRHAAPWWVWLGGILGGSYVLMNVYLVGHIGNGQTVTLLLFGQIAGSLAIEKFGLFYALKKPIRRVQVFGLIIMIVGVFLIRIT